jgi:hypothetical protein
LIVVADEWWVAEDVGAFGGREEVVPIHAEGVADVDVGGIFEREAEIGLGEGFEDAKVGLVVHEPEGDLGDAGGPLFDLDAVELVDVDLGEAVDLIKGEGLLAAVLSAENFEFECSEFTVGDDEEVAATAGGIEELELGEADAEGFETAGAATGAVFLDRFKFRSEGIEEQWVNYFEDVALGGVMRPDFAAFLIVHDLLEERAEDGGGDARPVEVGGFEKGFAHGAVEGGEFEALGEECAVNVGEGLEFGVEIALAAGGFGVEGAEEFGEASAEVTAVGVGAVFDVEAEGFGLEDAGVFGEEAEEDADEEAFEVVAGVATGFEGVVDSGHDVYGFEVEGVLGFIGGDLVAGDEVELTDVVGEFGEREFEALKAPGAEERKVELVVGLEIVEGEALEVGEEDVAGDLVASSDGLEVLDVVECLGFGGFEAGSSGLMLDEELALPEEIDEPVGPAQAADRFFKGGDGAARDIEDLEEFVPKGLLSACSRVAEDQSRAKRVARWWISFQDRLGIGQMYAD